MRKNIRNAIFALMGIIVLLIILTGISAGDTLAGAGVAIVAPFLILIFVIIWTIYLVSPTISRSLSSTRPKNKGIVHNVAKYASIISLLLFFVGLVIQALFILKGGPNQGWGLRSDIHIFSSPDNPYIDLQVGFLIMAAGIIFALILHVIRKLSQR